MSMVFNYPTNPAGKIKSIRVEFDNGDWWEHSATAEAPEKVRLCFARALVADMPGVVVAELPGEASPPMLCAGSTAWQLYIDGFNACLAAIKANGGKTDER